MDDGGTMSKVALYVSGRIGLCDGSLTSEVGFLIFMFSAPLGTSGGELDVFVVCRFLGAN